MKKLNIALLTSVSFLSMTALAENILRVTAPVNKAVEVSWSAGQTQYTPWQNTSVDCSAWSPNPASYTESALFEQTQACNIQQSRQVQKTLTSSAGQTKPDGEPLTEQQQISRNAARDYKIHTTEWVDGSYTCTNWTPLPSTVDEGKTFTQTASDCVVNQSRTRTESVKPEGGEAFQLVSSMTENKQLTGQTKSRDSVGTKALATNYMKVVNPVLGVNGIYTIDAGSQGTFQAYVDMTTDGGHWILVAN